MNSTFDGPGSIDHTNLPEFRPWKELAIISQLIMELAWIVPWYRSLTYGTNQASPGRVFSILFGILIITYFFARVMNYFRLRTLIRQTSFVIYSVFILFLALRFLLYFSEKMNLVELIQKPIIAFGDLLILIPDEFVIIIIVLFVLFRGVSIASQITSPRDMIVRFQLGLIMMVLFVAVNTLLTDEIPGDFLYLFLLSGLVAIGSSRMSVNERMRGGRETSFDRKWFTGMLVSAILTVFLGLVASRIVHIELINSIMLFVGLIGKILLGLFLLLLFPVFIGFLFILEWLGSQAKLGEMLPEIFANLQDMISQLDGIAYRVLDLARQYLPDLSISKPVWLWGGVLLVFLIGLLFVSFQWLVRNYARLEEDNLESIIDQNSISRLIKYIILRKIKGLGKQLELTLNSVFNPRKKAAARIRRIYQELCELGETFGAIRPEASTPLEFVGELEKVFPENIDAVREITTAYNKIRYGEYPEDMDEVEMITQAWQNIKNEASAKKTTKADASIPGK